MVEISLSYFNGWITKEKLGMFIEGIILVLILSDIILLTSLLFINVTTQVYTLIVYFDLCVVLILIPEFIYRLWKSEDKNQFMRSNWTDILGMIPEILVGPVSSVFRLFRLIRVIRIAALFKKEIRHFLEVIHQTKIDYGILVVLVVLFSGATILFLLEVSTNPNLNSYDDAFWFLVVTITTVGYGDVYPITLIGRIVTIIIMLVGIGFISFLTATITSLLVKTANNDKVKDSEDKLDQIQAEIKELKELIKNNKKN